MIRVCFVCMGNICRSPTAEGVFLDMLADAKLRGAFVVDSAGTGGWHAGERPDRRTLATAEKRGVPLPSVARQFVHADFAKFDYVVAMDQQNVSDLESLATDDVQRHKISRLRDWDEATRGDGNVPDPYYGGPQGFERVFDICVDGCRGLLAELRRRHGL